MVQINSFYVNDGQTVVTLFVGNGGKMIYEVNDIGKSIRRRSKLEISIPEEVKKEIEKKSEKVWGYDDELYILKNFDPWSAELGMFILHCWHEIRLNERTLFNK